MDPRSFLFVSLSGLLGDIAWQVAKGDHAVRDFIGATSELMSRGYFRRT